MVALREHPIPEIQLDSAIFEVSEGDEYRSVAKSFRRSVARTATGLSGFPSETLLRLIKRKDYIAANRLRAELVQHQHPITPDQLFVFPAISVARSHLDPAVKLEEFCAWLSLLPVADEVTKGQPKYGRLMHILSNDPHPDIELVMAFVSICVSKGYMIKIPEHMIPLVVRFAPPSVSLPFLEDLRSSVVKNFTLDKQMKRKIRLWCTTAMREYLGVGLVREAIQALQMGLRYGTSLPRVPSRWLGKAIMQDPDRFGLSDEAIAALMRPKIPLPYYEGPARRDGLKIDIPISDIPPALKPLGPDTDPADPRALVSKVVENSRSVKPLHSLEIMRFLDICDSLPPAIQLLSAYNHRKPARHRGQWVLGELLYYAKRKEWRELIGAFDTYFFRVGVPANIDKYKARGRITAPSVEQRLFPSSYHTSLVWKAVVKILEETDQIPTLFRELVEQARASKTRMRAKTDPWLLPGSTEAFSAHHFAPFLAAMYRKRRYKSLVAAFSEMSRLGIEPRVEELSLLAGAHAGIGKGHEAVHALHKMEGVLEEGTNESGSSPGDLPKDVSLYIPALKGFVAKEYTPGTRLVRERMLRRRSVKGINRDVDRILEEWDVR